MGLSAATLSGHRVTSARVMLSAWGCWYADTAVDGEIALRGPVELKVADLTLKGTVLSGGPAKGRSDFRIVGGAGGWGLPLAKESYANDAGVRLATVVGDAAGLAKETLDPATVSTSAKVGPAFERIEGDPASRVLQAVSRANWYVGEDGITRLGRRPRVPFTGLATRVTVDHARATIVLAAESIGALIPGAVVDGVEAVDVLHEISAKGGLRTTIWGATAANASRRLAALSSLLDQLDPDRKFRGITEYRVVTQQGKRLNLQPVRVSTGMPDLPRVTVRPGVSGCDSQVALGSRVLVGFADADRSRPAVLAFEDADGEGFVPLMTHIDADLLRLGLGVRPAIGAGDLAAIFPCIPTQTKVLV